MKGLRILTKGVRQVKLKQTGDIFHYQFPEAQSNNIIFGKRYNWFSNNFVIHNQTTGDSIQIVFLPRESKDEKNYRIEGKLCDQQGNQLYTLSGRWDQNLEARNLKTGEQERIATVKPLRSDSEFQYFFSDFIIGMNNLHPKLAEQLPRTDTRLRPDVRAFEYGNEKLAEAERSRLEQK